jgi:hypothetical protein
MKAGDWIPDTRRLTVRKLLGAFAKDFWVAKMKDPIKWIPTTFHQNNFNGFLDYNYFCIFTTFLDISQFFYCFVFKYFFVGCTGFAGLAGVP